MIELLLGAVLGWLAGNFVHHSLGTCLADLREENASLRTALRLARTWAAQADRHFLVAIIDRALADEQGA